MAVKVKDIDVMQKYFSGVVARANHHADGVKEILYSLLGIIILKKDVNTDIEVRGNHEDETGNILWVVVNGIRYAFKYEHSTGEIEIREHTFNGPLKLAISNSTTIAAILDVF